MNQIIDRKESQDNFFLFFCLIILSALIGSIIILCFTPPISRDALTHHLFIPKLWLQHASIAPLSDYTFSYYPMNLDLLYAVALYFGNDILPKYIHFFFALLTGGMIYQYISDRLSRSWGVFGALFFLSLPVIIKLSITTYVDLGLIAFSTASLLLILRWSENENIFYLILSGLMCGLAAGTKYNGLITVFLLTLLVPIIFNRTKQNQEKRSSILGILFMLVFVASTFFSYGPWLIRNYSSTGNPIYPLHNSLFQKAKETGSSESTTELDTLSINDAVKKITRRGSNTFANRKVLYGEKWWQALLLPVRFFIEGKDDDPRYFDGKLNPFLLIFMFFAIYHYKHSRETRLHLYIFLAFGWLFFFLTFFQEALRIRYIGVALPSFVILSTFGIHNVFNRLKHAKFFNRFNPTLILMVMITPIIAYNAHYLAGLFERYKPLEYITRQVTKEEYITRYLPEYPIQMYANETMEEGDKILAVYFGRRGYYFDYPVIFDLEGNTSIIGSTVMASDNAEDINSTLQAQGFTHMIIRFDLFTQQANRNLPKEKIHILNEFLTKNTKQLKSNSQYGLFELLGS